MAQKKYGGGVDKFKLKRDLASTGIKSSARDGALSKKVTSTEKQRSCKQGQVYSTKLKKCVARKGQDPRFCKDRPKKAKKAVSDWKSWKSRNKKMSLRGFKPGSMGEGPK